MTGPRINHLIRKGAVMKKDQLYELLYQTLETEAGGVQVYETAMQCAVNPDLKEEWQEYLEQTRKHEQMTRRLLEQMGLDPAKETPGRQIVRRKGESLVEVMKLALKKNNPQAAQLVAAECVVTAETKDHQNWELLGQAAEKLGAEGTAIKEAYEQVENQEDEHLYHTMGWSRELWMESLGLPAVLPPPEEEQDVKTAEDAAHAKASRIEMV
jgi:rubrerythrin